MLKSGVDVRVVRTTKPGDATLCAALRSRKFCVAESQSSASTSCSASATACSTRH